MKNYIKLISCFFKTINFWKTLYFNFHYFPFKVAIKIPVLIHYRTKLFILKGNIIIDSPISTGMIKIGSHGLGTQDGRYSRTIWQVEGTLLVSGKTNIGRGSKISIGKNGVLKIGRNFTISGDTTIICQKDIKFGNDCLLSWEILMMDTDFHAIKNECGNTQNSNKPIIIGDHVWIGCRNTILKGATIPRNCIVSANSLITTKFQEENCIIGGQGKNAGILKRGVFWTE